MRSRSALALAAGALVLLVGCGAGSTPASPTPFPTLLPLLTSQPSSLPSSSTEPTPTAASTSPEPTPTAALIVLPDEFTKIPTAHTYKYDAKSKGGILVQGTPKNMRLGTCGILMPVDVDGSLWDAAYGNDGHGGALTDAQLNDLRTAGRVTVTLVGPDTLQMVTRNGAFITFTRHDGSRRYAVCTGG